PPVLSDYDLYLLGEGTHQHIYDRLGAHPTTLDGVEGVAFVVVAQHARRGAHPTTLGGVEGVAFVVLAPNARRVSVVGDFNYWNPRRHPMRVRGNGYWELFIPRAKACDHHQVDVIGPRGQH